MQSSKHFVGLIILMVFGSVIYSQEVVTHSNGSCCRCGTVDIRRHPLPVVTDSKDKKTDFVKEEKVTKQQDQQQANVQQTSQADWLAAAARQKEHHQNGLLWVASVRIRDRARL